jgi:GTP-binding protein EngB required for normal cell division
MDKLDSLHRLSEILNRVTALLKTAAFFSSDESYSWLKEGIRELQNKLSTQHFYLGILGEFKRGKSTLLNALIGRNLIPTGVLPLTSIVTAVKYASEPSATVIYRTGDQGSIPPADLADYVTESRNPRNHKNVERVELFLPDELLQDGVVLLDTPGVGSFYEHNTELTYKWLSRLDAALFLLSPDPPVSNSEIHFLREVVRYVPHVFLVLNKIDRLDAESLQQVVDFSRQVIHKSVDIDPKVYPISARDALISRLKNNFEFDENSGLADLKRDLETFLISSKGEVFLRSSVSKIDRILDGLLLSLRTEKEFSELPAIQLQQNLVRLQEIGRDLERRKAEVQVLLRHQEEEITKWLERELESFQKTTTSDLKVQLKHFQSESGDLEAVLYQWFHKEMEDRTFGELGYLEMTLAQKLEESLHLYTESFEAIARKLSEDLGRIIDFPFRIEIGVPRLQPRGTFWISVKDPLEHVSLSAYSYFTYLSKSGSRKRLFRTYRESIGHQAEGSMGKLRLELLPRVQESFRRFYAAFEEDAGNAVKAIAAGLQRGLNYHAAQSSQKAETTRSLTEKMDVIAKAREELSTLGI